MVVIRKRGQIERHITGDALSESAGWTSEKGSCDGDGGEKARLKHAVVVHTATSGAQSSSSRRDLPMSSSDSPLRQRTACLDGESWQGFGQPEPSVAGVLPFESVSVRHEQIQVAYSSSAMVKRSAASEVGECPVLDVVDVEI